MMTDSLPYPDFVSETDQLRLDQALNRIVKALRLGEAQFLFGAGMSLPSGTPSCDQIAKALLKEYFPEGSDKSIPEDRLEGLIREYPFEALLEAIKVMPGSDADLKSKLSELILVKDFHPNQAHRDFLSICWGERGSLRIPIVFTTNFDRLLEEEIGDQRSVSITEGNTRRIGEAKREGKIPVVHLHGTLDGEYQATESQLFSNEYRVLHYEFEVALHNSDAFVFVGYSMNDPDFRRIYITYRERIRSRREFAKDTFVVSPATDFYSFAVGKAIWKERGAIWFPIEAKLFFAKLKQAMLRQYDTAVRRRVMEKYHLGDDKVLEGHVERAAQILRMTRDDALHFLNEALPRGGGAK